MARREQAADGVGNSLTDLMTSIAVIFILLFLLFVKDEQEERAIRERQTKTNLEMLFARLDGEMSAGVELQRDPDDPLTLMIVLRDNPELLSFRYNDALVRENGLRFLREFVPKLAGVVCADEAEKLIDSLIIEGHTDSQGTHDTNTDLSARRATAVLIESRKILANSETGSDGTSLESCFLGLSRATGRGEQDRIMRGGVEDSDSSRRVVVKVRVKSLEQRENVSSVPEGALRE